MKKNIGVLRKLKSDIDDFFKMTIDAGTKTNDEVYARMIYYKLYRIIDSESTLTEIGNSVNKNHATVVHGLKHFNEFYVYDKKFKYMYDTFMINHPYYLQEVYLKEKDIDIIQSLSSTIEFICSLNDYDRKKFIDELENLKKLFINDMEIKLKTE